MKGNEEMSQNHKNINIKAKLSVLVCHFFYFSAIFLRKFSITYHFFRITCDIFNKFSPQES